MQPSDFELFKYLMKQLSLQIALSKHHVLQLWICFSIGNFLLLLLFSPRNNCLIIFQKDFALIGTYSGTGHQRKIISPDYLSKPLELNLSVPCIAKLLGMSRCTVYRRMAESDLSVKALYSTMTDEELDQCVREIKSRQPNSGYRMMKALLQASGLRVQYNCVRASMHCVDTTGVINRMVHVGCIARRTYSVPGPQSLIR